MAQAATSPRSRRWGTTPSAWKGLRGSQKWRARTAAAPVDLDALPNGTVLVAELLNHCIRAITLDGMISTFAGMCGTKGFRGDGGPANLAWFNGPFAIHVDPVGSVWVADSFNQRIRRITASP